MLLHVIDADKMKMSFEAMDKYLPDGKIKSRETDDIKRYSPFFDQQLSCMMEDPVCKRGQKVLTKWQSLQKTGSKSKENDEAWKSC
jgi:hypothetical protein